MKLFYLAAAASANLNNEYVNEELIAMGNKLQWKFYNFLNFFADEGKIKPNLAEKLQKKYDRMIGKATEHLEKVNCLSFPDRDDLNGTLYDDEEETDRFNREDPCKHNKRLEKLTNDFLRDSLRRCDDGEVALKQFLTRNQQYRFIFAKTRNVLDCQFDHRGPKSTFWFDSDEYFSDFGSSYQSGERFCASEGMRLCTFEEYCPDGEYGATQKGFKIPFFKDAWAPFFDPDTLNQKDANKNNWLQVGFHKHDHVKDEEFYNKQCWINPWGKPWGLTNDGMVMKMGLCCATDSWL